LLSKLDAPIEVLLRIPEHTASIQYTTEATFRNGHVVH
jgi:hypothetical protein